MCVLVNMCACVVCVKWTSLVVKEKLCVSCYVCCLTHVVAVCKQTGAVVLLLLLLLLFELVQFVFLRYTFFLQEW